MSNQFIAIDSEKLEIAKKLLENIPRGFDRAFRNAADRAAKALEKNSSDEIGKRYDISKSNIRAYKNVKISHLDDEKGTNIYINFSGYKIPLYRYNGASPISDTRKNYLVNALVNGKWTKQHPSVAASGHQLKETKPTEFANAFTVSMKNGHTGIFERTGRETSNGKEGIQEIMGSSVAQMIGSETVKNALTQSAAEKFSERFDHEVERLVNGY